MDGLVLCLVAIAGLGPKGGVTLRFQPKGVATYDIHRVWRSSGAHFGNGNETDDIRVSVSRDGGKLLRLGVLRFRGRNDDRKDAFVTKRLPELSKNVTQMKLRRAIAERGAEEPWKWEGYNPSEWVGMMTAKACGMYEVGPFELHFPAGPVHIGSVWRAPVTLGDEGVDSPQTISVTGNTPLCTYRLDSVDTRRNTARLSFDVATVEKHRYDPFPRKGPGEEEMVERLSGGWTVDLATGMPLSFSSKRKVQTFIPFNSKKPYMTETTVTVATRI